MTDNSADPAGQIVLNRPLTILDENLLRQIDEALTRVGAFGEVRLVMVKGKLRFIQIMHSEQVADIKNVG